jgi:hypothetical protein
MESVYHIVTIRVNETSWAHVWRLRFRYLGTGYDSVIIYERPTTDHIRRIRHVVEATTLRWTFEGGTREATREALELLQHDAEKQMEQL